MNKKGLKIETNFLQEDDLNSPLMPGSNDNEQDKLKAATLLEKCLSITLAKNFIQCWNELKSYQTQQRIRVNNRAYQRQDISSNYSREERVNYFESNGSNVRSQSQLHKIMKSSGTSEAYEHSLRTKRNKSVRVINQEIENSRANILKEIVEKLRNIRNRSEVDETNSQNIQVLKKITHLEHMMRNMKSKGEISLKTRTRKASQASNSQKQQKQNNHNQQDNRTSTNQQDELVKSFIKEIQMIKKEIHQIKISNQVILKNELQKSQASRSASSSGEERIYNSRNQTHNRVNNVVSEGVQTQIQNLLGAQIQRQALVGAQPSASDPARLDHQTLQASDIRANQVIESMKSAFNLGAFQKFTTIKQEPLTSQVYPVGSLPNTSNRNQIAIYDTRNLIQNETYEPVLVARTMDDNINQQQVRARSTSSRPNLNIFNPQIISRDPKPVSNTHIGPPTFEIAQSIFPVQPQQQPQYYNHPQQIVASNQGPKIMQPNGKVSVSFGGRPPIAQSPPIQAPPVQIISRNMYQYPRSDQIKTNTTFYSKNNVYSDIDSSSSLGVVNWQAGHFRNPSIQVQDNTSSGYITFSNYCGACGRNCACPRNLNQARRS